MQRAYSQNSFHGGRVNSVNPSNHQRAVSYRFRSKGEEGQRRRYSLKHQSVYYKKMSHFLFPQTTERGASKSPTFLPAVQNLLLLSMKQGIMIFNKNAKERQGEGVKRDEERH